MKFIGITGGVGAGKSAILFYLDKKADIRVMLADEIAHELMKPGTECYDKIKETFSGADLYETDGSFDRRKLADFLFSDERRRLALNGIVHPAVKQYVKEQYALEKEKGVLSFLVLEAALLIEEHYDEICDELWYIYTSEENRRVRLKESRGYSDTKINGILKSQLTEDNYRSACAVVIDNNGPIEGTYAQIEKALGR